MGAGVPDRPRDRPGVGRETPPGPLMEIRRVVVGPLDTNCWVIHSSGSAVLVDPGDSPEAVLAAVRDLKVTAIVLTHVHFDHVMAADEVAEELGVPVLAH